MNALPRHKGTEATEFTLILVNGVSADGLGALVNEEKFDNLGDGLAGVECDGHGCGGFSCGELTLHFAPRLFGDRPGPSLRRPRILFATVKPAKVFWTPATLIEIVGLFEAVGGVTNKNRDRWDGL